MNYDKIILELLTRIKDLEDKVRILEQKIESENKPSRNEDLNEERLLRRERLLERREHMLMSDRISLAQQARDYINKSKEEAANEGTVSHLILRCNDIQKELGVANRAATICQAMYDCMGPDDEVLEAPQSGKSTTVTISYRIKNEKTENDNQEIIEKDESEQKTISLRQLKTGFEYYFRNKKPDYKHPGPLFGMAFYITRHNIGVRLEDLFSGKISLDEYGDILYRTFDELGSTNTYGRTSAYKDAMKNLLEYVHDSHLENVKIER